MSLKSAEIYVRMGWVNKFSGTMGEEIIGRDHRNATKG